jgi:hypothetical protein
MFFNFNVSGFLLFCTWAWNIICAADIFTWNLLFMFLNVGQLIYIVYQMRPVNFDEELEEAYQTLFYPFKVRIIEKIITPYNIFYYAFNLNYMYL